MAYASACRTRTSFRMGSRRLNPRYASTVPGACNTSSRGSRSSVSTMSPVIAFIAASALPLRSSSARVVMSGTTANRTRWILGAPPQYSGLRSSTTSLSSCAETKRNGPEPTGFEPSSFRLPSGTMPIAPSDRFHSSPASGSFMRNTTVNSSGVST